VYFPQLTKKKPYLLRKHLDFSGLMTNGAFHYTSGTRGGAVYVDRRWFELKQVYREAATHLVRCFFLYVDAWAS
jgi:hypothetical protein